MHRQKKVCYCGVMSYSNVGLGFAATSTIFVSVAATNTTHFFLVSVAAMDTIFVTVAATATVFSCVVHKNCVCCSNRHISFDISVAVTDTTLSLLVLEKEVCLLLLPAPSVAKGASLSILHLIVGTPWSGHSVANLSLVHGWKASHP